MLSGPHAVREDRARQALRDGIVRPQSFVEIGDFEHVEDRRERLFGRYGELFVPRRQHDGGLDEVSGPIQHASAVSDLSSLPASSGDRGGEALDGRARDQRTHEHARLERVADAHRPVRGDEPVDERPGNAALDE